MKRKDAGMTPEQKMKHLIDEVYGNLAIENPKVTREFVAEQLRLREEAKANKNGKANS